MLNSKMAVLVGALALSSVASADINSGLVAHWSFDDCTAADVTGHGYDGVVHGNPFCVDNLSGKGLLLNGVTDYIDVADAPTFNSPQFSVSMWAISNEPTTTSSDMLLNKENQYEIMLGSGALGYAVWGKNTWSGNYSSYKPKVGARFFLTMTYEGNKAVLFVNGNKSKEVNIPGPLRVTTSCLMIGRRGGCGASTLTSYFSGMVDEVRFYDRVITSAEIAELYDQGINVSGTVKSLGKHTVVCTNKTTGQTLNIPGTLSKNFDCEAKGLSVSPGDSISIAIEGNAR